MARFDWEAYEDAVAHEALTAARAVATRHPDHRFYMLAIHGFDAQVDDLVGTPLFALQSVGDSDPVVRAVASATRDKLGSSS